MQSTHSRIRKVVTVSTFYIEIISTVVYISMLTPHTSKTFLVQNIPLIIKTQLFTLYKQVTRFYGVTGN
jgi:hypothetical protein